MNTLMKIWTTFVVIVCFASCIKAQNFCQANDDTCCDSDTIMQEVIVDLTANFDIPEDFQAIIPMLSTCTSIVPLLEAGSLSSLIATMELEPHMVELIESLACGTDVVFALAQANFTVCDIPFAQYGYNGEACISSFCCNSCALYEAGEDCTNLKDLCNQGCDGVSDSGAVEDACGECGGDSSTCAGCDGVPNSGAVEDACGECGGDSSTCAGCDNVLNSGAVEDACGECGGDSSTCTGCDGVLNSGVVEDACGECGGDSSTCAGCDGEPNSGAVEDACGECGGDGSSCASSLPIPMIAGIGGGVVVLGGILFFVSKKKNSEPSSSEMRY